MHLFSASCSGDSDCHENISARYDVKKCQEGLTARTDS